MVQGVLRLVVEVEIERMVVLLEEEAAIQGVLQSSWKYWKILLMVLRPQVVQLVLQSSS